MPLPEKKTFYDEHPFDWTELYAPSELSRVISPVLLQLLDGLPLESIVLDVGCGAGRVVGYLVCRNIPCIGVDTSYHSVRLMAERWQQPAIVADNLFLPIRGEVADLVISDGVLHHTNDPYRAFHENCRVLKRGGRMYLAVYKPGGRYEFLYRYPGRIVRWLLRNPLSRALVHATLLPLYFGVHWLRSGGKTTWSGARNLFYDYFVTPQVSFASQPTVAEWCRKSGMTVVSYDPRRRENVHCFVLQKP